MAYRCLQNESLSPPRLACHSRPRVRLGQVMARHLVTNVSSSPRLSHLTIPYHFQTKCGRRLGHAPAPCEEAQTEYIQKTPSLSLGSPSWRKHPRLSWPAKIQHCRPVVASSSANCANA